MVGRPGRVPFGPRGLGATSTRSSRTAATCDDTATMRTPMPAPPARTAGASSTAAPATCGSSTAWRQTRSPGPWKCGSPPPGEGGCPTRSTRPAPCAGLRRTAPAGPARSWCGGPRCGLPTEMGRRGVLAPGGRRAGPAGRAPRRGKCRVGQRRRWNRRPGDIDRRRRRVAAAGGRRPVGGRRPGRLAGRGLGGHRRGRRGHAPDQCRVGRDPGDRPLTPRRAAAPVMVPGLEVAGLVPRGRQRPRQPGPPAADTPGRGGDRDGGGGHAHSLCRHRAGVDARRPLPGLPVSTGVRPRLRPGALRSRLPRRHPSLPPAPGGGQPGAARAGAGGPSRSATTRVPPRAR